MLDMKVLLSEFTAHVVSMTDDDVRASIQNAERLTAGCANEVGDIGEYDSITTNETGFQSFSTAAPPCTDYSFISVRSVDAWNLVTMWMAEVNDAA